MAYGRETSQILAHRYAIFLCSWDVEIDDSLVGQLTSGEGDTLKWNIRFLARFSFWVKWYAIVKM